MIHKVILLLLVFTSTIAKAEIEDQIVQEAKDAGAFYGKYISMTDGLMDFCKNAKYVPEDFIQDFEKTFAPQIERAKLTIKRLPEETKNEVLNLRSTVIPNILEEDYKTFSQKAGNNISKTSYCVFYDDNRKEVIERLRKDLEKQYPNWFSDKEEIKLKTSPGWIPFTTRDHAKSRGIDLKIDYPINWSKAEAKGEHIIQTFTEQNQEDLLKQCALMVQDADIYASSDQWKESLDDSDFQFEDFLPSKSSLLYAQKKYYDGEPGFSMEYTTNQQYNGVGIIQHIMSHNVFYKNYFISIQCAVTGSEYMEWLITKEFKKYHNVFVDFGNSLVINSKYTASDSKIEDNSNIKAKETDISYLQYDKNAIILAIILSIVFTWGVGLLVPWFIRYKIFKHPVKEPFAVILATIQFFVMLMISISFGNRGKHLALILIAYIAHSILKRQDKVKKADENDKSN